MFLGNYGTFSLEIYFFNVAGADRWPGYTQYTEMEWDFECQRKSWLDTMIFNNVWKTGYWLL